jgi:hypothetical protein
MSASDRQRIIDALLDTMPTDTIAALLRERIADAQELLVRVIETADPPTPTRH